MFWLLTALIFGASAGEWRERQADALARGWEEHPDLYSTWSEAEPRTSRPGMLVFQGEGVDDPRLLPLYLQRLFEGDEPPEVRRALVDLLPRCGGDWEAPVLELIATDADPGVRAMAVSTLRRATDPVAEQGLSLALADEVPWVRAEGARVAGWHPVGARLAAELAVALTDPDAEVREAAAVSVGWHGQTSALPSVARLLSDPEPGVRLAAVRALERLDPDGVGGRVVGLADDPDPRVRRAVARTQRD